MRTVARLFSVAVLAAVLGIVAGANPAFAWWRFAQWGMSPDQIVSASRGQAVPCRPDVPVCSRVLTGAAPSLVIESVDMVGLHGATAFIFDAKGELIRTVVLFPSVDFAQASGMVQGIHGKATQDSAAARVWRDERRRSIVTVATSGAGTLLTYTPMN
jgi:hypothetical protein